MLTELKLKVNNVENLIEWYFSDSKMFRHFIIKSH